jgi:hypothetical protein
MLISVLISIAAGTEVGLVAEPEEYGSPDAVSPFDDGNGSRSGPSLACGNFRGSAFD